MLFLLPEQRSLSRSGRLGEPFLSLPVTSRLNLACSGMKIKCDQQITPQQGGRGGGTPSDGGEERGIESYKPHSSQLTQGSEGGESDGLPLAIYTSRGIYRHMTLSCERIEQGIPSLLFVCSSTHSP